ncbi:hypothetical protein [Luteimonas sp. 9C]|uniref:hypothetical protein n=1 Tax=Luteimonas sp. 9C TaxID=2653148 RepID=UPI00135C666C|nr:hypothetical protein [Luteimonas sp. 9C]
MGDGIAALGLLWMLFVAVLAILWILVPFAIFGIKPLLRDLIREQKTTQALLTTISQQVYPISVEATRTQAGHADRIDTTPHA